MTICSLVCSSILLSIHPVINNLCIHLYTYLSIYSFIDPFIHWIINQFIHSFILIHPFPDLHGSATITEVRENGNVVSGNQDNKYQVKSGSTVTLKCQPPTGHPQPIIIWTLYTDPIVNDRVSYHNMSTVLMISNIQANNNGGEYRCTANNTIGNRESQPVEILISTPGQYFKAILYENF